VSSRDASATADGGINQAKSGLNRAVWVMNVFAVESKVGGGQKACSIALFANFKTGGVDG
jgi:hypothetical protein